MPPLRTPPLVVRPAGRMGRGVFAGRPFRAGEVVEVCPALVLPPGSVEAALGGLAAYVYRWGAAGDRLAIALGYGSLYNHSPDPNAAFTLRLARRQVVFRAVRAIPAGAQVLIDYGWEVDDYAAFRRTG